MEMDNTEFALKKMSDIKRQIQLVRTSLRSPRLIVLSRNDYNRLLQYAETQVYRQGTEESARMKLYGVELKANDNFPDGIIGVISQEEYNKWGGGADCDKEVVEESLPREEE